MEDLIKMDDFGGTPIFLETPIYRFIGILNRCAKLLALKRPPFFLFRSPGSGESDVSGRELRAPDSLWACVCGAKATMEAFGPDWCRHSLGHQCTSNSNSGATDDH